MGVVITGRQMEITPALKKYIEDRSKKLGKFGSKAPQVMFTLKVEKHRHIAEALVKVNGVVFQALEETDAMYASVDMAIQKIERQLRKYKEKLRNHRLRQEASAHDQVQEDGSVPGGVASKIKKIKDIQIQPMTLEEAASQIESLGEEFFLFGNRENDRLNVLYKRKDGSLGLIHTSHSR